MRILFTMRPQEGSCGGGMFFLKNMVKYLDENGHEVVYDFSKKIDLIFIMDPRRNRTNHIPIEMIERYKSEYPDVKIIHRVNEPDIKRPRPIGIEPLLIRTMRIADVIVFVSKWLMEYFVGKYDLKLNTKYVINGCDSDVFYPSKTVPKNDKLRIVTHHWSNNIMKGFRVYNFIDNLIGEGKLDIEFIYIGRYIDGYIPKNIKLIPPTTGKELADILRDCDIYLTATQNEPGAMHYVEGLSCGLPVLYAKGGGGVNEVCSKYGFEFDNVENLIEGMTKLSKKKYEIRTKIDYKYLSSERCCNEYLNIINSI